MDKVTAEEFEHFIDKANLGNSFLDAKALDIFNRMCFMFPKEPEICKNCTFYYPKDFTTCFNGHKPCEETFFCGDFKRSE